MAPGAAGHSSARNRTEAEPGAITIALRVYDYARVDRARMLGAETEATTILARAGVEARWVDCSTSKADLDNYPDCQSPWQANDFVLKVLPKAMVDSKVIWQEAMGFSFRCDTLGTCSSSVFYDRVQSLSQGGRGPLPVLLGLAMAHEIGHLLLGTHSHSSTGIMRARWFGEDITLAACPHLLFTAQQSRQMKTRLAERAQAWQLQAEAVELGR